MTTVNFVTQVIAVRDRQAATKLAAGMIAQDRSISCCM